MPKPRIFLSSTCYDLSTIRAELAVFLEKRGFEVINSEDKNFGVTPGMHSHAACVSQVGQADFMLLLIGSRRGGTYIGSLSSITNEEYKAAEKLEIPRIVAVLRSVWDYRKTYTLNPTGNHKHIVDDVRIFSFIDYIASGHSDNWMQTFETIGDLKNILTTQFAHYLTLFSNGMRRSQPKVSGQECEIVDFPSSLDGCAALYPNQDEETAFRNGLRSLHEILRKIVSDGTKKGAKSEKLKQLWVVGQFGESEFGNTIYMSIDQFKQYAWSTYRGTRVNKQFKDYRITCDYDDRYDEWRIVMVFDDAAGTAGTNFFRIGGVAARARIHGGNQRKASGKFQGSLGAGNGNHAVFQRLAEIFQN